MDWRELLPQLIETGAYRTQGELVHAVAQQTGRRVNQASVSRELGSLGVRKVDGVYQLAVEVEVDSAARVHAVIETASGCLVVVKTDSAFASVLGQMIDDSRLPHILGTIAGDNTVFVATDGPEALDGLYTLLGWQGEARRRSP